MHVLNTLRLCTFVCASTLYLWKCPCIQCHTMGPATNPIITQKSTSPSPTDVQPKSLFKMTESAVNYIYSSSTKQNVLTSIDRNAIEPSFTVIAQENTNHVIFISSSQDSMTLPNGYIRPTLVTSAVSHNPLDAMSTTAAVHPRTELTTVSADIMQQHSLPELSTPFYKLKSSGLTDQVTSTGILNAEHITDYSQVTEFLTFTVDSVSDAANTPSFGSYQQGGTTTTTSALDLTTTSSKAESRGKSSLVVTKLNSNSGYITTPGFEEGMEYPNRMNDTHCISFNSSEGQVLLLTFHFFELERSYGGKCRYDYLQLSVIGGNDTKHNIWKKCGRQSVPYRVFNQSDVCLQFVSDYFVESKGFKATFSILPKSKGRYQLDGGFFNCSAITSNQRSEHFDCNLVTECSNKQDESSCSYSSSDCPGLVDAGSQCYTSILLSNITWADARKECRRLHQTLVSPDTPEEWQNFTKVMSGKGIVAYVGLHLTQSTAEVPSMYRNIWAWDTGSTAFYVQLDRNYYFWYSVPSCALFLPETSNTTLFAVSCDQARDALVVCQAEHPSKSQIPIPTLQTTNSSFSIKTENCSGGFLVHAFLSCDPESHCHDDMRQEECLKKASTPNIQMFECHHSKLQSVHYTLVCDFKADCRDFSDESFCIHDTCPEDSCLNGQCIKSDDRCDGMVHCVDGSDETCPGHFNVYYLGSSNQAVPPPAMITLGGRGSFQAVPLNDSCPSSHFQCNDLYCLPSYLRCNGVSDCTDHEDENEDCETETKAVCRGFFRCRKSKVCVHPENVCDGVFHCPQRDDEMLCNAECPQGCTCQGLAFACNIAVSINDSYSQLRYLEIRDANVSRVDLSKFTHLVLLRLSNCGLSAVDIVAQKSLQNLRTLDLRNNALESIHLKDLIILHSLCSLVLSGNPLQSISPAADKIITLQIVDLSQTKLSTINSTTLSYFPSVKVLNMSQSALTTVTGKVFKATADLRVVDFRGAPLISYPNDMLRSLSHLREVYADDFRLCCKGALPKHFIGDMCHAPQDSIASCDDLLRSKMYRVFLWVVASIALFGNAGSFVTRCFAQGELRQSSFMMFVTNLSLADFLMGVYLVIVGAADLAFQSQYWKQADNWKSSPACKVAGFLSVLSSEVSAFFICLITLDRFLVLRFPFSRFHFSHRSTLVACAVAWAVGLVLAAVPLLPWKERWNLYGQTGICIPLPFARRDTFKGYMYSFSVMIVLNFALFLLIAVGQVSIYWSVRASELTQIRKSTKSKDAVIARRLLTIVLSDFLCWFPIGVLGLLAYTGTPIHLEISVAVAVFVMPFNSALNPFLYTFNMVMEKRRLATEERILQRLKSHLQRNEWQQANSIHSITEGQRTDSCGSRLSLTAR